MDTTPATMRFGVALLLVAVLGVTAFTPPPPRLFGPPRTRAQALAYAKQAVFKDADKDSVATPVPHLKASRQGRIDMIIDLGRVSGARPLSPTKRYKPLARPHRTTLHCRCTSASWRAGPAAAHHSTPPPPTPAICTSNSKRWCGPGNNPALHIGSGRQHENHFKLVRRAGEWLARSILRTARVSCDESLSLAASHIRPRCVGSSTLRRGLTGAESASLPSCKRVDPCCYERGARVF